MSGRINENVNEQSKPTYKVNVGSQVGYKKLGEERILILGPRSEVSVERNGWHGTAGFGVGTALTADLEVGKEVYFNKILGLDFTANASKFN